jgi:phosphatidylglycerol:prolipoprotein diacylglycerol transferase
VFLAEQWYGLVFLTAFLVTYLLSRYQLKERGLKPQKDLVLDMFFWAIVGLLVGARLFDIATYDPRYTTITTPCRSSSPFPA